MNTNLFTDTRTAFTAKTDKELKKLIGYLGW